MLFAFLPLWYTSAFVYLLPVSLCILCILLSDWRMNFILFKNIIPWIYVTRLGLCFARVTSVYKIAYAYLLSCPNLILSRGYSLYYRHVMWHEKQLPCYLSYGIDLIFFLNFGLWSNSRKTPINPPVGRHLGPRIGLEFKLALITISRLSLGAVFCFIVNKASRSNNILETNSVSWLRFHITVTLYFYQILKNVS